MAINITACPRASSGGFQGRPRTSIGGNPRYTMQPLRDMEARAEAQQRASAQQMAEFFRRIVRQLFDDYPDLESIDIEMGEDEATQTIFLEGDLTRSEREDLRAVLRAAVGRQARGAVLGSWTRARLSAEGHEGYGPGSTATAVGLLIDEKG